MTVASTVVEDITSKIGATVGVKDGFILGISERISVGTEDGFNDEKRLGCEEGILLGLEEGIRVGKDVGTAEGLKLGPIEGNSEGKDVGTAEGIVEGITLGTGEGLKLGLIEGNSEGKDVGIREGRREGKPVVGFAVGFLDGDKVGSSVAVDGIGAEVHVPKRCIIEDPKSAIALDKIVPSIFIE